MRHVTLLGALCTGACFGLISLTNVQADPIIFYDDFTHGLSWTPDNPTCSEVEFAVDSLGLLYLSNPGTCNGLARVLKATLCRPIPTDEDFTAMFKWVTLDDDYPKLGGVYLEGYANAAGAPQQVFGMGWSDLSSETNFGSLLLTAHGGSIYVSPFNTVGVFNGIMEIRRSGNRWTAWVNGTQMGVPVIVSPYNQIDFLQLTFLAVPGNTRVVKVDFAMVRIQTPGDINRDWRGNVGDVVYLINWIFNGGPNPVEPDSANCP